MRLLIALGALGLLVSSASADRVHLVGGTVIEGKATRRDGKVIVELESGEISLPAESVTEIEAGESDVQRVDARYAKLAPGDIAGLMSLAGYCRDHGMRARERELLMKVIERAPDHAEARARLGYVRDGNGWITRDEQRRAAGLVEYDGQWLTREQVLERERLQAQTQIAQREREKAQLEVERQRLELERQRDEAEAAKQALASAASPAAEPDSSTTMTFATPYYANGVVLAPGAYATESESDCAIHFGSRRHRGHCRRAAPARRRPPFPIPGAKDPFDYLEGR